MAQPDECGVSELTIRGEIVADDDSWWYDWLDQRYVCPQDFRAALEGAGDVLVRIDSPGGDVIAGSCLYTALREHAMHGHVVRVRVEGLAASIASVVAMAGTVVEMSPTAYMMIHDPWTTVMGNPDELRDCADQLDEIAAGIVDAYAQRTGMTRAHVRQLMRDETWMSARSAVKLGFADRIMGAEDAPEAVEAETCGVIDAAARARWQMRAVACARAHSTAPADNGADEAIRQARARLLLQLSIQGVDVYDHSQDA